MWRRGKVGGKLLGVTLVSLLMALVGLLLVIQYLATRQILDWHRQRVELVARLVLAEYRGKIQRVEQAASLLADNPTYGELLASGNAEALRRLVTPLMTGHRPPHPDHYRLPGGHPGPGPRSRGPGR